MGKRTPAGRDAAAAQPKVTSRPTMNQVLAQLSARAAAAAIGGRITGGDERAHRAGRHGAVGTARTPGRSLRRSPREARRCLSPPRAGARNQKLPDLDRQVRPRRAATPETPPTNRRLVAFHEAFLPSPRVTPA